MTGAARRQVGDKRPEAVENLRFGTTLFTVNSPADLPPVERRGQTSRHLPAHRQWTPLARALSVAGDNWTLAIVAELRDGPMRLSTLRDRLANVSAGVLDRYLQRMGESGLVTRVRFREVPPRVEFELTDAGRELLELVALASRWGLRWAWSGPRDGEIVDLDALLRALPSLIDGAVKAPDGAVELVLDERGERRRHIAEIAHGGVTMWREGDRSAPQVTASVHGDCGAWAAALGPVGDTSGLRLSGRRGQARRLLASLVRPQPVRSGERAPPPRA